MLITLFKSHFGVTAIKQISNYIKTPNHSIQNYKRLNIVPKIRYLNIVYISN